MATRLYKVTVQNSIQPSTIQHNFEIDFLRMQILWPLALFHGILEYFFKDIQIFVPTIFEYSYSVHYDITNIFLFVFGQKNDPEYIRIHIHILSQKKTIRYTMVTNFSCKISWFKRHTIYSSSFWWILYLRRPSVFL